MSKRDAALNLIARQLAIFNGVYLDRVPPKRQAEYKTLATNILATIERTQLSYRWDHPDNDTNSIYSSRVALGPNPAWPK